MNYKYIKDTNILLNVISKYNINISNISKLSKNKYVMKILQKLKKIYKQIKIDNNKISVSTILLTNNLLDNKFTSNEIKNNIKKYLKYGYKISYNNIIINYYSKKKL
jgi:hypothetical protein